MSGRHHAITTRRVFSSLLSTCKNEVRCARPSSNIRFASSKSPPKMYPAQSAIKAAYYRGGTSRAVMFMGRDLPKDSRSAFLQIMGAPDRYGRQLNGMGAGVSSLSKICIVEPSTKQGIDVDYTFVGIGIENEEVDYAGNCGNMSAAIGPFAWNERILANVTDYQKDGEVTVSIWQINTKKLIRSTFRVNNGEAQVDDSTQVDGVSGLGTGVFLDFVDPAGSKTGKLLPTGNIIDRFGDIEATCVDAANPCVFVRAKDIGVDPTILPAQLQPQAEIMAKLEDIRSSAAVAMGICKSKDSVPRVIPKIALVSPAVSQLVLSGETIPSEQLDLVIRFISDTLPHRAIPLTGALCAAAAAKIQGSIVQQCLGDRLVDGNVITIGHPSGRVQVNAKTDDGGNLESCTVVRTARRLMEGKVYWSDLMGE